MLACFMGHLKIVRLLLKNGAIVTDTDNGGENDIKNDTDIQAVKGLTRHRT